MPASRPRAGFRPIPHNLDIDEIVESYDHIQYANRIEFDAIAENGLAKLESLVRLHVIEKGRPLVIDGLDKYLDPWTFTPKWLCDNVGSKVEEARDLNQGVNMQITIGHYLKSLAGVANQSFRPLPEPGSKARQPQRIYLKDIDVPDVWQDKLREHIPPFLYYLNETTGDLGGPGADLDPWTHRPGPGIAHAGDLMSCLPPEMRAENMMCYIGHEGTYTPAHREMCASMGHNIMVEASGESAEDGTPERPGSSIWFMTEAEDRNTVSEYWLSTLGHDIETENHFAQINSWKKAPFNVFVVVQKPGDLILIPPLAPHQVWNRGTRTMKVAWNRTTLETLGLALSEALPKARMVCRDEQYKNKAIVYHTLLKYSALLTSARATADRLPPDVGRAMMSEKGSKILRLRKEFGTLIEYFRTILLSEMWDPNDGQEQCEYLPFDSNVTCAYCRCNIFNRFLSCPTCADDLGLPQPEPYDVCMDCYVMGRSCYCISGMKWAEQFKWNDLVSKYEAWRNQYAQLVTNPLKANPPITMSLDDEWAALTKRTLAQVTREQLKRRPFQDSSKPREQEVYNAHDGLSDEEMVVDDEGRVKKTVKKRSKSFKAQHSQCHICKNPHPNWKVARCVKCSRFYCYSSLFRGHDDMPMAIMEDPEWVCVHCNGICFGGSCAKLPDQTPFQPKGTLLGHDTKKIADIRSVEVLVDFAKPNTYWIRPDAGSDESLQMRRAREDAERAKIANDALQGDDDDDAVDDDPNAPQPGPDGTFLDPALLDESQMAQSLTQYNNNALPPPDAMVQGMPPTGSSSTNNTRGLDGYVPVTTGGFVQRFFYDEPPDNSAYTDPMADSMDLDHHPLENVMLTGESQVGQKRARTADNDDEISMEIPRKKYRASDGAAMIAKMKSEAGRQFQTLSQKKALEKARLQGRYNVVRNAQLGRKRLLKFSLPPGRLAEIFKSNKTTDGDRHGEEAQDGQDEQIEDAPGLLRSDVGPRTGLGPKAETKTSTANQHVGGTTSRTRKKIKSSVVNISDDEEDGSDKETPAVGQSALQNGKRRISAYVRAKHGDDDDADRLESLPMDHGARRRRRERPSDGNSASPRASNASVQQKTAKTRTSTGKPRGRPRGRPSGWTSVNAVPVSSDVERSPSAHPRGSEANRQSESPPPPQGSPMLTEQELNRRAKLEALGMVQDEVESSGLEMVSSPAVRASPAPVANMMGSHEQDIGSKTPDSRQSIFSRKGPGGRNKKIKIVSKEA